MQTFATNFLTPYTLPNYFGCDFIYTSLVNLNVAVHYQLRDLRGQK